MSKYRNRCSRSNNLQIDYRSTEALRLPKNQARKHPPKQIGKIAHSIETFGFNAPILVTADGEVIAGAARLTAAKQLGYDEIPVVEIGHLTKAQVKAFRIADNRLTEDGIWDFGALEIELGEILELDVNFDLTLTGFELPEIDSVLYPAEPSDSQVPNPDDEVPSSAEPVSQRGDLWLLGDHRLLCGDATSQDDLDKLLAREPGFIADRADLTSTAYATGRLSNLPSRLKPSQ